MEYNGISLSDISTVLFEQQPIYTDDGVQYLYDLYRIRVHALYAPGLEPSNPGDPPAKTYAELVGCLSKPQQQLIFKDGTTTLLYAPQKGFKVDAKNGPQPQVFAVKQLSPGAFAVEFEILAWQYNCCQYIGQQPAETRVDGTTPYIAMRWSETVSIDEKFASKVVRKGKMWFRSDILSQLGTKADDYRDIVVGACPLRPRFLRSSEYTVQENGLILEFAITDTEQLAMPLSNVRKWDAEYRMITIKGSSFRDEMHVRVEGDNNTSKFLLFQAAFQIASSRLLSTGGAKKTIVGGYFADKVNENVVMLHLVTNAAAASESFYGLQFGPGGAIFNGLDPQGSNSSLPNQVPDPGGRGSATTLYLAAGILQDPCLEAAIKAVPGGGQGDRVPTRVDDSITPAKINVVPAVLNTRTKYDAYQGDNTNYVDTVMDISYEKTLHTLQMPVASSSLTACSFAATAQPTMRKIVTYSMETIGAPPTLPATVSGDPNEVLLGFRIVPNALDVEADGSSPNWRVTGEYVYGLKDPTNVQIAAGKPAWLVADFSDTVIPQGNFVAGLTSPDLGASLTAKGVY